MGIWVVLIILSEAFIDLYVKNRVKKHYERLEETGGEKNLPPVLSHKGFIRVTRPYKNPGAILGFLKKKKVLLNVLTVLVMLLALAAIVFFTIEKDDAVIPLAIMYGGGLANFIDRMRHGAVTDFLVIKPVKNVVFNLADLFIFIGALIAIADMIL